LVSYREIVRGHTGPFFGITFVFVVGRQDQNRPQFMAHVLIIEGFSRALVYFRLPLIRMLQRAGHEVTVATCFEDGDGVRASMQDMGVRCEHLPIVRNRIRPIGDLMLLWSMWRLMRRSRPDVLLTWTLKPNLYGPLAGRLAGVNRIGIVVCGLGRLLLRRGFLSRLGWWMLRASARRTDCVFVQNQDDLLSLQDHGVVGATEGPVLTAGCGVDLDAFPVAPLPDQPVVLMLARLLASKGVHEYIEAAAIVRRQQPEVRFRLAGLFETGNDAVSESSIDAAVERGDVEYLGFLESQDMVRDAIRRSSLYVLPSWHEGTPHSTLEAMSMGRAVVTTDVRGCRETAVDGLNGRLVPWKDSEALGAAILGVLGCAGQLASMGAESRKRAEDLFDADRVGALIMSKIGL